MSWSFEDFLLFKDLPDIRVVTSHIEELWKEYGKKNVFVNIRKDGYTDYIREKEQIKVRSDIGVPRYYEFYSNDLGVTPYKVKPYEYKRKLIDPSSNLGTNDKDKE